MEAQELKLRRLRALRGQLDQTNLNNVALSEFIFDFVLIDLCEFFHRCDFTRKNAGFRIQIVFRCWMHYSCRLYFELEPLPNR